MLIDRATILIKSGKGGDGHIAFRREKYIPKGGPTGGDGGNGGDVVLVTDFDVDTLLDFAGRHHWFAQPGDPGGIKQKYGSDGKDKMIKVPLGTLVYDDATGELLADLDKPDQRIVIAKGGRGGFGNEHFKSATNQTPREFTYGEPAIEKRLRLELKLIADVGLVGKPNAGKSTLLAAISHAKPKIADYPFTTLQPNLGIAQLGAEASSRRLVVADIPGLIEGAAEGQGLGHEFLRHIERTRILVHVLEIEPTDGSDPIENYHVIQRELEDYSSELAQKPQIIVLSKMDLLMTTEDRETAELLMVEQLKLPIYPISSATQLGVDQLLEKCWEAVQIQKKQSEQEERQKKIDENQDENQDENDHENTPSHPKQGWGR